jgi:hypothetical protein
MLAREAGKGLSLRRACGQGKQKPGGSKRAPGAETQRGETCKAFDQTRQAQNRATKQIISYTERYATAPLIVIPAQAGTRSAAARHESVSGKFAFTVMTLLRRRESGFPLARE